MTERKQGSTKMRVAVLGLIGTVLTGCGGLAGAVISGAATIYQLEREMQQMAVAGPASGQILDIDATSFYVSRQEAAALDPESYFVDLETGLILRRPLPGWGELERLTVAEQMAENSTAPTTTPLGQQPVYRIRYPVPVEIQFDRHTRINDQPLTEERANVLEQLFGSGPWTLPYYSQVTLNVFDRATVAQLGITDLPDLLIVVTSVSDARVNQLTAAEGSGFAVTVSSISYENVLVAGDEDSLTMESWLLLAEATDAFYIVEISYAPQSGQSVRVWDDLQTYMDSFRVIQ